MKNLIVVDIDGVLADCKHRLHYILDDNGTKKENKDWDKFYEECINDKPIKEMFDIVSCLDNKFEVLFLTGRNSKIRQQTIDFLNNNFKFFKQGSLLMRKDGDRRKDDIVKKELLDKFLKENVRFKVLAIFEDREHICEMWKKEGYLVLKVSA